MQKRFSQNCISTTAWAHSQRKAVQRRFFSNISHCSRGWLKTNCNFWQSANPTDLFLNTFTNNADLHSNLLHWTEEKKVLFLSEKQTDFLITFLTRSYCICSIDFESFNTAPGRSCTDSWEKPLLFCSSLALLHSSSKKAASTAPPATCSTFPGNRKHPPHLPVSGASHQPAPKHCSEAQMTVPLAAYNPPSYRAFP